MTRKEINRARYDRQYARRTPVLGKVRFVGPVVYNCPIPRWTRQQFLDMWQCYYAPAKTSPTHRRPYG